MGLRAGGALGEVPSSRSGKILRCSNLPAGRMDDKIGISKRTLFILGLNADDHVYVVAVLVG